MVDIIVGGDCANDNGSDNCIIDEATADFSETTAAYATACVQAGGMVFLVEQAVNVACVDATDTDTMRYQIAFRNIDICAAPDVCTDTMVEFLFLSKGRDVLEALFDAAAVDNQALVCYDADDCSFVRSSPGAPEVNVALLPGCPTLAPTLSPTTSGATTASGWFLTWGAVVVWAMKRSW